MPKHAQNEPEGIADVSGARSAAPEETSSDQSKVSSSDQPVRQPDQAAKNARPSKLAGSHAGGFSYRGDNEDEYPDAFESLEPKDNPPLLFGEETVVQPEEPTGLHGKQTETVPSYQHKSRRMRKILIAIIVLLVLLLIALGVFTYWLIDESRTLASQQMQQQGSQAIDELDQDGTTDASTATEKRTEVPDLVSLLGMNQEDAVKALERGATVTNTREVNEEGNPIKTSVTVALTDEPADTRSGTPTVYLGLNEDGAIVQAGYSVATASLGYGSLSFIDAVENDHIIEKTLEEAGVSVAEGSVELPEDKMAYSTYDSDGTTLVRENASFSGTADINGAAHEWSAMLQYDYTTANTTGNLADTIRYVYVYINA